MSGEEFESYVYTGEKKEIPNDAFLPPLKYLSEHWQARKFDLEDIFAKNRKKYLHNIPRAEYFRAIRDKRITVANLKKDFEKMLEMKMKEGFLAKGYYMLRPTEKVKSDYKDNGNEPDIIGTSLDMEQEAILTPIVVRGELELFKALTFTQGAWEDVTLSRYVKMIKDMEAQGFVTKELCLKPLEPELYAPRTI